MGNNYHLNPELWIGGVKKDEQWKWKDGTNMTKELSNQIKDEYYSHECLLLSKKHETLNISFSSGHCYNMYQYVCQLVPEVSCQDGLQRVKTATVSLLHKLIGMTQEKIARILEMSQICLQQVKSLNVHSRKKKKIKRMRMVTTTVKNTGLVDMMSSETEILSGQMLQILMRIAVMAALGWTF